MKSPTDALEAGAGALDAEAEGEQWKAGGYATTTDSYRKHESRSRLAATQAAALRSLASDLPGLVADARRYRWLRDLKCNSFTLSRDDQHAPNYETAAEFLETSHGQQWCADSTPDELQAMKDTNTIWCLQVYPNTPVGFNVWNYATLDAAIDAAIDSK